MFKNKRGQSALEYLMTYGWALIVIVIVIAALVFLIQPSQVGGNTCSTTSGILITNHLVADGNITLALSNQTASSISDLRIVVSGTADGDTGEETPLRLGTVQENKSLVLTPEIETGQPYTLTVVFSYTDRDSFARTVTSTCNGTA